MIPGKSLEKELRKISSDKEVMDFVKLALKHGKVSLFVVHLVDQLQLLDKTLPLPPPPSMETNEADQVQEEEPQTDKVQE